MSRYRGILAFLVLPTLIACDALEDARSRFAGTDTLSVTARSGLVLGLQLPGTLGPGEMGVVRIAVTNNADTTVTHVGLELIVPGWAEPLPPRPGDREVTMAALPEGGTRFSYTMASTPIDPGAVQTVEQRIRVPAADSTGVPENRTVRARLLGSDGEALAEVEGEMGFGDDARKDGATVSTHGSGEARDRIGPVRLGMTSAALRRAVPSARDTSWSQEGTSERGSWVTLENGGRTLAVLDGDSVVRLEVRDTPVRTPEGVGVGSTVGELRSTWGTPCVGIGEGIVVVWFADAPGVSFALDMPVPDDVAGLRDDPGTIPASARVERWWLRGNGEACER